MPFGILLMQVAFGGDQLTVERSRNAQARRVNSDNFVDALEGLLPFPADWHAEANFLQVFVCVCVCVSAYVHNLNA